jgi:hypothetical protein
MASRVAQNQPGFLVTFGLASGTPQENPSWGTDFSASHGGIRENAAA